jgi:hypothetical protein
MVTPFNTFIIEANPDEKTLVSVGDAFFTRDITWGNGRMENATQTGKVVYAPALGVKNEYGDSIIPKVGDTIYYNYHATVKGAVSAVPGEPNLFRVTYQQIYAILTETTIIPLHDIVFCTPLDEDREVGGLILPCAGDEKNMAEIKYLSDHSRKQGLCEGDRVYRGGVNYYNEIRGEKLILIKNRYVEFVKVVESNNFAATT